MAPKAFPRRWHRAGPRLLSPAGQQEGTCPSQRRHPLSTPQGPQDCPEPPAERAELTFGSAAPSPREGPGASGDRAGMAGTGLASPSSPSPAPRGDARGRGCPALLEGGHPAALRLFWTPPTLVSLPPQHPRAARAHGRGGCAERGWERREGGREARKEGGREGGSGVRYFSIPGSGGPLTKALLNCSRSGL